MLVTDIVGKNVLSTLNYSTYINSQVYDARYINVGDGCKKRKYQGQVRNVGDQFGFLVTNFVTNTMLQCRDPRDVKDDA